jgi:hypothetical protein
MTFAIVLVLFAALALVFVLRISVRSALQISSAADGQNQIQPIDLVAFRNLADPSEEDYLRRLLPSVEYRRIQRLRLKAMAAYIQIAGKNAGLLILLGQTALGASDPVTVAAARELVNDALLLRRNAAFALFRIYIAWAWPNAGFAATPILDGYQQLNGSAMLLGRLQNPAAPVRIAVS